ncbi:MAG: hypothetical protein JNM43_23030 [Planctomycetaceae bacterium]|nr:hypothetical protein [Planctomycetaceae bacterium]
MKRNQLPTAIEELRTMLLEQHRQMQTMLAEKEALRQEAEQAKREVVIAKQQTIELTSTVTKQKKELERSERTIKELLQALKGKKRERLDPNQLLLFELGELEQLIEEAARTEETQPDQNAATKPAARKK